MASGILWQKQLTIAFGSIGATYAATTPPVLIMVKPGREIKWNNLTNVDIQISMDGGLTDSFPVAARTGQVDDMTANSKPCGDDGAEQDNMTNIAMHYIGATAPTSGAMYISYWCEKGE